MLLRSYVVDNGGVNIRLFWYQCDRCKSEVHESWPHYSEPDGNIHYCWDCSYLEGKITEKEHLRHTSCGWMNNAHSSIVDGKVIVWVGKKEPWKRKNQDYRKTQQYKDWRKLVFERDGYRCKNCSTNRKLQAHHIKQFALYKKLRFELSNGITLCEKCHREEHKRMKQGDINGRRVSNE
jgi:5-methylcytosine-specific restriction endonuclease McrA